MGRFTLSAGKLTRHYFFQSRISCGRYVRLRRVRPTRLMQAWTRKFFGRRARRFGRP